MADELFRGWWINRFPNRILDSTEHSDFNRWAIAYTLKSWGWSDVAAAGVVANVIHESFANPACWEYCADVEHQNYAGSCGYIPGAYLFAWTPWTKWGDYAAAHGMEEYDGCAQMQFLIDTLSQYWFLYDHYGLGSDLFPTWEDYAYRSDYSPEIAARAWCSYYEKPNEDPAINHIAERIASAQEWYTKITTEQPPSGLPSCAGGGCIYNPRLSDAGMQGAKYWYTEANPFYPEFGLPNCTCYAWGRWWEIWEASGYTASVPELPTSDGGQWWADNLSSGTYAWGPDPSLGAVACFEDLDGGAGHVAVVEQIDVDGTVTLSNSAYGGDYFLLGYLPPGETILWGHFRLQGYIINPHACAMVTPPSPGEEGKHKFLFFLKPFWRMRKF